ncbi:MAG: 1-(5-phosphoribosyl)-5-[(5-phosphoribosylamino)methylideneamino]imidazole-4-carboxamide isomerase [Actinomycetota bacterium]|nr:1-(5-phosphoribosyl)-5-[(5-phosphoribosylamino)methylideneamino]imidazole-4-carboxamide isomerase [Actinomycetota bacterium]
MILYPAIDILDGRAVRLRQGRFEEPTVYADDPREAALTWVSAGARALHVVDLDGARVGRPVNLEAVRAIVQSVDVPVQVGGGIRSKPAVEDVLAAGAARVVLGTAAYRDPDLLAAALADHGDAVAVAVDVRGGRVATAGWTESIDQTPENVIPHLDASGVRYIVYTDVDRDGMLEGPDVVRIAELAAIVTARLIYSGGIGAAADLEALAGMDLDGVIVGKALYERRFTVAAGQDALAAA